jgi:hypothetical protein
MSIVAVESSPALPVMLRGLLAAAAAAAMTAAGMLTGSKDGNLTQVVGVKVELAVLAVFHKMEHQVPLLIPPPAVTGGKIVTGLCLEAVYIPSKAVRTCI